MIESLMAELLTLPDLTFVWGIMFFLGFGLGFGGLCLYLFWWTPNQVNHGLHLSVIGFVVIGICMAVLISSGGESNDLRKEIKSEHISLVTEMSCDDIRLEIISVMERANEKRIQPYDYQRVNLAWEEGYYYAKCEIPLRDEVMKLQ